METLRDARGSRRFARARAWNPPVEGTRTKLLPPDSATSWSDPTLEARTGWTPFFLPACLSFPLFLFFWKASYIVVWGFLISQKRFREFQEFWLTGNTNGNLKNQNGTQLSTDWTHMGVTAHWISTTFVAVKTPGQKVLPTHFFHLRDFFHAPPQTNWPPEEGCSPLPYFKVWPFSFCSSHPFIFSPNWDFGEAM